ncbi:methyltransferase-like protein 27 [Dendronephthya gigantea]|uniref:methyltransferase-like protein 27 n=1 Tax=Dendronephthya gigantea TaxID=151771 RepID=UPI00106AE52A|nr:methyltransferase-like protein 27 [Dendronephthya gigantea]XP_028409601.1 methyltransferase-like protein 27 [Dendronephthya gigantea]
MAAENFDWHAHITGLIARRNVTSEELKDAYSSWGKGYDESMVEDHNYKGPAVAAELFAQKLKEFGYSNDAHIVDLGCGTGLVGEQLWKHGYKNIDGVDLTPKFLELAKAKGIYGSLKQGILGSPQCKELGIEENRYDAAICVGVLSIAHAPREGLDDLAHVVKPGGLACCSIRDLALNDAESGYQEKMEQLCKDGKWKLVTKHYHPKYQLKEDGAWYFIYQIL